MKITLRYLNGALRGREVDFNRLPVVMGADPRDDVFYDGFFHRMVSKSHAQLLAQGGQLVLADRTDGKSTFVNGRAIPEGSAVAIKAGDELMLGEGGPGIVVLRIEGDLGGQETISLDATPSAPPPLPAAPAAPPRPAEKLKLEFLDGARQGQAREFSGAQVTLGRKPDCSMVFERPDEDAPVSGRHVELDWDGFHWQLTDLNSTNGTYVNGVRVNKASLKTGDIVQLTPKGAKIRVTAGDAPVAKTAAVPAAGAEGGKTVMLGAVGGDTAPPALHFEILSGDRKGERLSFTQPQVKVGRAADNQVAVSDSQGGVSGHHAECKFEEGAWMLRDLNSTNGTYLDGKKLAGPHPLKSGETIRLSAWGPELKVTLGAAPEVSQKVGQKTMQMAIHNAVSAVRRDEDRKRGEAIADVESKQASARRGLWILLLLVIAGSGVGGGLLWKRSRDAAIREQAAAEREKAMIAQLADMKRQNEEMNAHLAEYEKRDAEKNAKINDLLAQASAGGAQAGAAYNQLLGEVGDLKAQNGALRAQLSGQLKNAQQQRASMGDPNDPDTIARRKQLDGMIDQYNQRMADLDRKSKLLDQRLAQAGNSGAAAASGGGGLSKAQIYSMNVKAIVLIRHKYQSGDKVYEAEGTGWCVKSSGLIITNRHVAMPWTEEHEQGRSLELSVFFSGSKDGYEADIVRDHPNPEVDLAAIRIRGGGSFPTVAGIEQTDDSLNVGDEAYIIGYPLGTGTYHEGVATPTFTAGSISKKTKFRIQYDATTYPGSSGSPVFDNQGHVAAIHFSGQTNQGQKAQGINYGVPVDYVHELIK